MSQISISCVPSKLKESWYLIVFEVGRFIYAREWLLFKKILYQFWNFNVTWLVWIDQTFLKHKLPRRVFDLIIHEHDKGVHLSTHPNRTIPSHSYAPWIAHLHHPWKHPISNLLLLKIGRPLDEGSLRYHVLVHIHDARSDAFMWRYRNGSTIISSCSSEKSSGFFLPLHKTVHVVFFTTFFRYFIFILHKWALYVALATRKLTETSILMDLT